MSKKDDLYTLTEHIDNPLARSFTLYILSQAPWHFWLKPSSAGKYHPPDEHGFEGLLLHTIRVVKVGLVICDSAQGRLDPNVVIPSCFLHDICRYGVGVAYGGTDAEYSLPEHPALASGLIRTLGNSSGSFVTRIADAVEAHTGRWGKVIPRNDEEWAVHYADCIAANYHQWGA